MKRLKSIFNTLYFAYLIISLALFIFRDGLVNQMDEQFLFRFTNFWVILGFVFFIAIWIIQAVQIGFLRKDIADLEAKVLELKSKLYDFGRHTEREINPKPAERPPQQNPQNPE